MMINREPVLSLVFSILFIWYSRNTGHSFWVYWAPFFLAAGALVLGIPVYLGQRRHMAQPASRRPTGELARGGAPSLRPPRSGSPP